MQSYFSVAAERLVMPLEKEGERGLRPAQVAAAQAVASHFYAHSQAALVSMPTGSGKTTVMLLCAVFLRAKRVLIVAPSRALRDQLHDVFTNLGILRVSGALATTYPLPRVAKVERRPHNQEAWRALEAYDVVVSTVSGTSPFYDEVAPPPSGIFDVVMFDEAHHTTSPSWSALMKHFASTQQVLFTATPFRQDRRMIKARLVFEYPLARARRDGLFGELKFEPVRVSKSGSADLAIAKAVEHRFFADQRAKQDHLVMVRSSSQKRASELHKLYREKTKLKLGLILGKHTLTHIRAVLKDLKGGKLHGIVCVDMLGEGLDLPRLKLAALHSPHKSLAVTLQFIGRFARTNDPRVGEATFFAVVQEIHGEAAELYREGAEWNELVEKASRARIEDENEARAAVETFGVLIANDESVPDEVSLDLSDIRPRFHVKIYSVPSGVDVARTLDTRLPGETVWVRQSEELACVVVVSRDVTRSRWSSDPDIANSTHDLLLVYFHDASRTLFVHSSRHIVSVYEEVVRAVSNGGEAEELSIEELNRVLRGVEGAKFFNVGMRRRIGGDESYRTVSGRAADRRLSNSDGRMYDRGHCYGTGQEEGRSITLGFSSASKVWSNRQGRVSELIDWMKRIGEKISETTPVRTGSGLDHLPMPTALAAYPSVILSGELDEVFYAPGFEIFRAEDEEELIESQNLDLVVEQSGEQEIAFTLRGLDDDLAGKCRLQGLSKVELSDPNDYRCTIDGEEISLLQAMKEYPPRFFSSDLRVIVGKSISGKIPDDYFDRLQIEEVDWESHSVNPRLEKPDPGNPGRSLFEWTEARSVAEGDLVFNDDGPGEACDYLSLKDLGNDLTRVNLYHCKASGAGPIPGKRIDDLYDVVGQGIKCLKVMTNQRLRDHLHRRLSVLGPSRLVKGVSGDIDLLLSDRKQVRTRIYLVQPGIGRALGKDQDTLLAAANAFVREEGREGVFVVGSCPSMVD